MINALKIVSKGKEAYKSVDRVTDENSDIERVTDELLASSRKLSGSLADCGVKPNDSAAIQEDAGLIAIAQSCEKIAGSLLNLLDTFKIEPGKLRRLRSLGQALKAAWKKDEVEQLEATLRAIKDSRTLGSSYHSGRNALRLGSQMKAGAPQCNQANQTLPEFALTSSIIRVHNAMRVSIRVQEIP